MVRIRFITNEEALYAQAELAGEAFTICRVIHQVCRWPLTDKVNPLGSLGRPGLMRRRRSMLASYVAAPFGAANSKEKSMAIEWGLVQSAISATARLGGVWLGGS